MEVSVRIISRNLLKPAIPVEYCSTKKTSYVSKT